MVRALSLDQQGSKPKCFNTMQEESVKFVFAKQPNSCNPLAVLPNQKPLTSRAPKK